MSKKAKVSIVVVIAIIIVTGVFIIRSGKQGAQVAGQASVNPSAQASPSSVVSLPTQDTSDASLNQDLNAVDTELGNLNTASANVDKSLNDTPITQN